MKHCRLFLLSFLLLAPNAHAGEVLKFEKCDRFKNEPLFVVLEEAVDSWEEAYKASGIGFKDEAKCAATAQGLVDETATMLTTIAEAKSAACLMEGSGAGDRRDSCCHALKDISRQVNLKKDEMIREARKSCTSKAN